MLDIENPHLSLARNLALTVWPNLDGKAPQYLARALRNGPVYCPQCFEDRDALQPLMADDGEGLDDDLSCEECGWAFVVSLP